MKVLMFGWEFPPLSSGGLGTACYGLTKSMSKKGTSITFVLPYSADASDHEFLKLIPATGIKIKRIASSLKPYMTSQQYSSSVSRNKYKATIYGATLFDEVSRYNLEAERIAMEEEFDVIHCHDWMTYGAGIKAKNMKNKPLVVHVHSTEFDRSGNNGVHQYVYDIERSGMHAADKVIAVSQQLKDKIVHHYGIPSEKVSVVHNAVDFQEFAKNYHSRIKDNDKIVLFLGRMTLQKGPDYFIYAAKKVLEHEKNVKFIIAGTGDMERFAIEKAAEMGISSKVLFAGFLNQVEVEKAFKMADVYVMPSVSDPFGISALESMKNGTPVIVSKQSGVSEVISHCLKVDFWDVNEISNKIISVLRYSQLRESLEENADSEVRKFNWDIPAQKCIDIYNEVLRR